MVDRRISMVTEIDERTNRERNRAKWTSIQRADIHTYILRIRGIRNEPGGANIFLPYPSDKRRPAKIATVECPAGNSSFHEVLLPIADDLIRVDQFSIGFHVE